MAGGWQEGDEPMLGELVRFGTHVDSYGREFEVSELDGPLLELASGEVTLADPWLVEAMPSEATMSLRRGQHRSLLSTIVVAPPHEDPAPAACAAVLGDVESVVSWRLLGEGTESSMFDSDSGLGAFYDQSDAELLRPFFADALYMQKVYDRALSELVVPMEIGGRVVAVVFVCSDGPALYRVATGHDSDGTAVALMVDLGYLWIEVPPVSRMDSADAAHLFAMLGALVHAHPVLSHGGLAQRDIPVDPYEMFRGVIRFLLPLMGDATEEYDECAEVLEWLEQAWVRGPQPVRDLMATCLTDTLPTLDMRRKQLLSKLGPHLRRFVP